MSAIVDPKRVVASLHLKGDRFIERGMPANTLSEVAALNEIICELMELYWRRDHPQRVRLPKRFRDSIQLRLAVIEEGSSTPLLERPLSTHEGEGALFDATEDWKIRKLCDAVNTVEDLLAAVASGSAIPADIREISPVYIRRLGYSLGEGEYLQVQEGYADEIKWSEKPRYDINSRRQILKELGTSYTEQTTFEGLVKSSDYESSTFEIADRKTSKTATVSYLGHPTFSSSVSGAVTKNITWAKVEGLLEFSSTGVPKQFLTVDSLDSDDMSEDYNAALGRLASFASLDSGWVDGDEGETISSEVIEAAEKLLEHSATLRAIPTALFPTEEGGVSFLWKEEDEHLSLEIESDLSIYIHKSDINTGKYKDQQLLFAQVDLKNLLDNWIGVSIND